MDGLNQMLLGAIALGFFVIALFFFRFWRQGGDRLFLLFALSFTVEGCNRAALGLSEHPNEGTPLVYAVRLTSFLLVVAAIRDKNGVFKRRR